MVENFAAKPAEKSVEVDNLKLWFGDRQVLQGITLDIFKHKVTAVIGPSGCGKSTMLRCFNRMSDLAEDVKITGRITVDNENVFDPRLDVCTLRSKVGMVFQRPNPFPKSIFDNVAYGLRVKGLGNRKKIAEKVELSLRQAWLWDEVKDRLHASAFCLSGGQQQRLCIARAMATDPEIILFDEPTSALDPQSTAKVEELVLELKNKVTVIMVTHNIGQAGRVADYTIFLYLGECIEYGETERLFTIPKEKKTENYLVGKFG